MDFQCLCWADPPEYRMNRSSSISISPCWLFWKTPDLCIFTLFQGPFDTCLQPFPFSPGAGNSPPKIKWLNCKRCTELVWRVYSKTGFKSLSSLTIFSPLHKKFSPVEGSFLKIGEQREPLFEHLDGLLKVSDHFEVDCDVEISIGTVGFAKRKTFVQVHDASLMFSGVEHAGPEVEGELTRFQPVFVELFEYLHCLCNILLFVGLYPLLIYQLTSYRRTRGTSDSSLARLKLIFWPIFLTDSWSCCFGDLENERLL